MTKIFDEKKKTLNSSALTEEDLPFADESPEKLPIIEHSNYRNNNKLNNMDSSKFYRDPSLHKCQYSITKLNTQFTNGKGESKIKEILESEKEKDEDSTMAQDDQENILPDNERHIISPEKISLNTNKINILTVNLNSNNSTKLKRSESLNKSEQRTSSSSSPLNNNIKRSESLTKTNNNEKLKRSDSLTKTEKTESNINKRREMTNLARRTNKDFTKLKRKNGMPDRSIKRRHTVGGTKDLDKINLIDNRNQEEVETVRENQKEKNLRTSSPDLSTTRREKFVFELNVFTPDEMVFSIRQNFSRPQSFPVYKVPLESHV